MTPVEERLRRRIAMTGPITVAEYMSACLTDPDGYYASRDPFGEAGDFVTAPEISQMFGEIVGAFLLERWIAEGRPAPFDLVELGPGRGTLMRDVLRVAGRDPRFRGAARVVLVEASQRLRQVQRALLAPLHSNITWADAPPTERPLYLVANEFLDALPIRQHVSRGGRWFERVVGDSEGRLSFGLSPFPVGLSSAPDGAVRELRPAADTVAAAVAEAIARNGVGVALFIDYGYRGPDFGDTLQAVKGHAPVEVLDRPGEADLSAHVDFGALAKAVEPTGAAVHGPVEQGEFLLRLGLLERAGALGAGADRAVQERIHQVVRRLAGDREGEMGSLFKALAITARAEPPPGFQVVNGPAG